MKKIANRITLILCLSLLTACGSGNQPETTDEVTLGTIQNTVPTVLAAGTVDDAAGKQTFLSPEYDYVGNKLSLIDLATGAPIASYSFETAQTPMLAEKTGGGVVMLSGQIAADVRNTNGISVIAGEDSAQTLTFWQFDDGMKLLKKYNLTDPALVEGLLGYTFAVSPDGRELTYAAGDRLYCYTFETQNLKEIDLKTDETVYYEAIHYSTSGKYLAFIGSLADRNGTAYGSFRLSDGTGKTFFADNFLGMTLSVNGEYAAVADTVLPDSMGGPAETGNVLYIDMARQQGGQIAVESGVESGLAAVSADGRYVVTCMGDDSSGGVLRVYRASDGVKATEQPYTMNVACKPYRVLIQGQSAYAALAAESGHLLSPAVTLP